MKIRNGFVSNSSSSSFVIRGIKIKKDQLKGLTEEEKQENDKIEDFINKKLKVKYGDGLKVFSPLNYFSCCDGETSENIIVGKEGDNVFDDGDMVCADEFTFPDDEIKDKLIKALGVSPDIQLKTFLQFISNDNY